MIRLGPNVFDLSMKFINFHQIYYLIDHNSIDNIRSGIELVKRSNHHTGRL